MGYDVLKAKQDKIKAYTLDVIVFCWQHQVHLVELYKTVV